MTEEVIGTARLDIVVNTGDMESGVSRAVRLQNELEQNNTKATQSAEKNSQRQINALERQIATYGKSTDAVIEWRIQQQTTGKVADELTAKLNAQRQAVAAAAANFKNFTFSPTQLYSINKSLADFKKGLNDGGKATDEATKKFNQFGLTAKQQAAALRGLPAQITDIVTGIASGQRPLTILFQQGGQLKDMFGGIVPAARALGGAIVEMVNPLTLAAGAVLGLGLAWNKAEERMASFRQALDLTGNVAGLTTDQLADMAAELDKTTNATQGKASEVLAQVASTGKFTADQIREVAQAAIEMEDATGRSIKQTVADFASLKDDPLDAILKLNDAIGDGTNVIQFLQPEQLKLIEKYKEQGNQAAATQVAVDALYNAIHTRAPQAVQDVGLIAGAFRGMKNGIKEGFDEFINGFANADRAAKHFFQGVGNVFTGLQGGPAGAFSLVQSLQTGTTGGHAAPTPGSAHTVDTQAEKEYLALKERYQTREEQKSKALAELDRLRLKLHLSDLDVAKIRAGIEERFKPPKTPKSGIEGAQAKQDVQAFEDELRKEQGLIANQTQILEANYAARNVSVKDYYEEQKRLAQENSTAQEKALEGEIAVLEARNVKGKVSIENATELAQKEAALAKVRADGAAAQKVLNIQEDASLKQRQQLLETYNNSLADTENALKDEMNNQVLRISIGEREYETLTKINQLRREEAKTLRDLALAKAQDPTNAEFYDAEAKAVEESFDRQVRAVRQGYAAMSEAQKNWANGALKAFTDYRDAANDVAGQTYSIFSDALHGLEDVLTDFFTKGKADWKGFFDGIAAEITRFVIRQQLNKLIKKFIPGMGDDASGNADALKGAAGDLAASAGPLLGAASALSASAAALAAAGAAAGGGGFSGGSTGSSGGFLSQLFGMFFNSGGEQIYAKGGAFLGGAEIKAFANGGVVGSPTYFPMAGGKMGLMGEEKPEAIMPLKRGPDGRLGVVAQVPQSQRPVVINNNTNFNMPSRYSPQTEAQMAQTQQRVASRASARNR